jgi:hypothetical protein
MCLWLADLDFSDLFRELKIVILVIIAVMVMVLSPWLRHFGEVILGNRLVVDVLSLG